MFAKHTPLSKGRFGGVEAPPDRRSTIPDVIPEVTP
jgi:hypothetical protein